MLIFAPQRFYAVICMIKKNFLDNGVMTTPKRRFLSFVFTVLCLKILNSYYSFTIEMRVAEC